MHEVLDGSRRIRFDGTLLAYSTSYRPGSQRWVEFSLFRTIGGSYVLSRTGMTTIYHDPRCAIANRAGLPPTPRAALPGNRTPCESCQPHRSSADEVCVETARHWAQTTTAPEAVVDMLYQHDESGARYLTGVAKRLLEEASSADLGVANAYEVEIIY